MSVAAAILARTGQTATIAPYIGENAVGPVYGPTVDVACYREAKRQIVPDLEGRENTSTSTVYLPPGTVCPAQSLVTVNGHTSYVLEQKIWDAGAIPAPNHVEVRLQ